MRARCPGRRGKAQSPSQAGVCYLQPYKVLQTQTLKLAETNFNSKHCLSPGGRFKVGQPRSRDGDEDYQRIPLSKAMYRSPLPKKWKEIKKNLPQNQNYSFAMHQSKNMCLPHYK